MSTTDNYIKLNNHANILCRFFVNNKTKLIIIKDDNNVRIVDSEYPDETTTLSFIELLKLNTSLADLNAKHKTYFSSSNIENNPFTIELGDNLHILLRKGSLNSDGTFSIGVNLTDGFSYLNRLAWKFELVSVNSSVYIDREQGFFIEPISNRDTGSDLLPEFTNLLSRLLNSILY